MKAFPRQITFNNGISQGTWIDDGMELRDYFAAKAMQAIISNEHTEELHPDAHSISQYAYVVADAMMEARKQ